jgi:hypothetical protein
MGDKKPKPKPIPDRKPMKKPGPPKPPHPDGEKK